MLLSLLFAASTVTPTPSFLTNNGLLIEMRRMRPAQVDLLTDTAAECMAAMDPIPFYSCGTAIRRAQFKLAAFTTTAEFLKGMRKAHLRMSPTATKMAPVKQYQQALDAFFDAATELQETVVTYYAAGGQ